MKAAVADSTNAVGPLPADTLFFLAGRGDCRVFLGADAVTAEDGICEADHSLLGPARAAFDPRDERPRPPRTGAKVLGHGSNVEVARLSLWLSRWRQ